MEYRMKRVITLALQCTELICLLCTIYANQVKRIASAGSQSCKPLPPVEHGTYTCSENLESVHCELKCLPFYLIPITQIGPNQTRMSLKERGVYRCVDEAGGKVWSPPLIFDCVEARYPTDITFYFAVTVKISSGECNDKDTSIRTKFNNAVKVLINHQRCTNLHCRSVQTSSCDGKNIIADIELIMNFDEDLEYSHIQNWADKELTQKLISLFPDYIVTLNNNTAINCPEGTLLQRDLTCRGCSKGYFLDGSDMQCKPCPAGHYQDLTLQLNCKPCPQNAPRDMNGLQSISDCFHVDSCKYIKTLKNDK